MTEFVASNGIGLRVREDTFQYKSSHAGKWRAEWSANSDYMAALREYCLHERDTELGRWRSKVDPMWTAVVDDEHGLIRFQHDGGLLGFSTRRETRSYIGGLPKYQEITKEWLAAHPVRQPWHDAKPGEVWVLDYRRPGSGALESKRRAIVVTGDSFCTELGDITAIESEYIEFGCRVILEDGEVVA